MLKSLMNIKEAIVAGEENDLISERFKSQATWTLIGYCILSDMGTQLLEGFEQRSNIVCIVF